MNPSPSNPLSHLHSREPSSPTQLAFSPHPSSSTTNSPSQRNVILHSLWFQTWSFYKTIQKQPHYQSWKFYKTSRWIFKEQLLCMIHAVHSSKTAHVAPLFKKGSPSAAENYSPVSLTCIPCKSLEHILCSHIRGHLDKFGVLTPLNHGFRKQHACESQLLITGQDLINRKDIRLEPRSMLEF